MFKISIVVIVLLLSGLGGQHLLHKQTKVENKQLLVAQGVASEHLSQAAAANKTLENALRIKDLEMKSLKEAIQIKENEIARVTVASDELKLKFEEFTHENKEMRDWLDRSLSLATVLSVGCVKPPSQDAVSY